MKIALLLRREPFDRILTETLERFLPTLSGTDHRVKWLGGLAKWRPPDPTAERWLCNPHLNAVFVPGAPADVLEPVVREFGRSRVGWRRPLQRAYVRSALRPGRATLLARAAVTISPGLGSGRGLLIVGGNQKLRVLDRPNGRSYGILKAGFEDHFFRRELAARERACDFDLPVPRLLGVGDGYFEEEWVVGTPLNRLADSRLGDEAIGGTLDALSRLYARTEYEATVGAYTAELIERSRDALSRIGGPGAADLAHTLDRVERWLDRFAGECIPIASCHGDLQPANILYDDGRLWLIDWEYAGEHPVGYDHLRFALQSVPANERSALLEKIVRAGRLEGPLGERWGALPLAAEAQGRRLLAMLFCIAQVGVQVQELANPLFLRARDDLRRVAREARAMTMAVGA